MSVQTDEDEHSIEMHLPYIAKVMERYLPIINLDSINNCIHIRCIFKPLACKCYIYFSRRGQFTIVPVLVGSLSVDKEQTYGKLFSKYLTDPENLFVISSDFCHWGEIDLPGPSHYYFE